MTTPFAIWLQRQNEVVEAYRLDRYDNLEVALISKAPVSCRSLSFG